MNHGEITLWKALSTDDFVSSKMNENLIDNNLAARTGLTEYVLMMLQNQVGRGPCSRSDQN
jgi:hypothetical protein